MRQDVIIVGAPRSGTNMLRDVLTQFHGVSSWPCDEINAIWRHGNREHRSDEMTPDMATPGISRYIHSQFDRIAKKYDAQTVVEKTCATSLRVEFTRKIFPRARYIFITRDGVDCAASAVDRWHAPLDLRYTAAKSRFVPASDLPYYGLRFAAKQFKRRQSPDGSVQTWWGPKPHDYQELMQAHTLDEICMLQWQRCVDAAQRGLAGLPDQQLFEISYEKFVAEPLQPLQALLEFLELPHNGMLATAVANVSPSSLGKGRRKLGEQKSARLEALASSTLRGLGDVS